MIAAFEFSGGGAAICVVSAAGALAYPVLRLPRPARIAGVILLRLASFLAPLLVPLPFTVRRMLVALMAITLGVKLYDLYWAAEAGVLPSLSDFAIHLVNPCNLLIRRVASPKNWTRQAEFVRGLWRTLLAIICSQLVLVIWSLDWRVWPWTLEHCVKVIAVCGFVQFATNSVASGFRLIGAPAIDFSGWFFVAATPAEFWRRWNRPAGQFLSQYLFLPAGGMCRPLVAVMATFAFNGLMHEYLFDIASGRFLGLAFVFFLTQGLATGATMKLRPRGWWRVAGMGLTLGFNLLTSMLLFATVNKVLPFYASH